MRDARLTGVLLMAYGTPASADSVEAYYTHIRRGRPPSAEQLRDLLKRYEAIGGSSPLLANCRAQAAALELALDALGCGPFRVELGMKHAPPFIEDALQRLLDADVQRVVGLILAPHRSALSVDEYIARARAAAGGLIELTFIESWHLMGRYLDLLALRVQEALRALRADHARRSPRSRSANVHVLFTAHSLPERILQWGDPYPAQLRQTAEAVADRARLTRFSIAWQSAGRTDEQWLRPDVLEAVGAIAAQGGDGVVVCPAGFTSDHLEILYDLDIECRREAESLGLPWRRTESLNDAPALMAGLAGLVAEAVADAGSAAGDSSGAATGAAR